LNATGAIGAAAGAFTGISAANAEVAAVIKNAAPADNIFFMTLAPVTH
jgi:hypothetical protein